MSSSIISTAAIITLSITDFLWNARRRLIHLRNIIKRALALGVKETSESNVFDKDN